MKRMKRNSIFAAMIFVCIGALAFNESKNINKLPFEKGVVIKVAEAQSLFYIDGDDRGYPIPSFFVCNVGDTLQFKKKGTTLIDITNLN